MEFDKDSRDLLDIDGAVPRLQFFNFGGETLNFRASPVDRVNLFANQELQAVSRPLLLLEPTCCDGTGLILVGGAVQMADILLGRISALLRGLQPRRIGLFDQFDLGPFQLHGRFLSLLDLIFQLADVRGDPDVFNPLRAEHATQFRFVQVVIGDSGEEHCPRRNAVRVCRREGVGLSQVDVIDALPRYEIEDKAWRHLSTHTHAPRQPGSIHSPRNTQAIKQWAKYRALFEQFEIAKRASCFWPAPPVALTGKSTGHVIQQPTKQMIVISLR